MRPHTRKLISFYVYHLLGIPNPLPFKKKWIPGWLAETETFKEEREAAERVVKLGRDT